MSTINFLHGIETIELNDAPRPITTSKSSVIGIVGTAGKGPVNTPVLILGSRRDAVSIFGSNKNDGFTIPAALDAIFDNGGAVVVVVNVLDPDTHETEEDTDETITLKVGTGTLGKGFIRTFGMANDVTAPYIVTTAGQVNLPAGCTIVDVKNRTTGAVLNSGAIAALAIGDVVTVDYTATLTEDVDFTLDKEHGIIKRVLDNSKLLQNATVDVSYTYVDPTTTQAEIIGEESGGSRSGVQCLLDAANEVHVQPRILAVPGWTHQKVSPVLRNAVIVELLSIAKKLKAVIVADADGSKEQAVAHQSDFADSDRVLFVYPFDKVLAPGVDGEIIELPGSARVAGLIAQVDNDEGFYVSPSNHARPGILGINRSVDFAFGDGNTTANYLNENNVCTTVNVQGYRFWGNRMADGTFILARRTSDMIQEAILYSHLWAVDRNVRKGYLDLVVEGVNNYLRYLKRQGAILGGRAWADPELNTVDVIANGQVFIDYDFTTNKPAEHLTFRAHINNNYVSEIFAQ